MRRRVTSVQSSGRVPEPLPGDVAVPGGRWQIGSTSEDGFIFDNEKWAHDAALQPFKIARAPVTNAEFAAFVEAGGYRTREFWSDAGWAWREQRAAEQPVYWQGKRDGVWTARRYRRSRNWRRTRPSCS